MSDTTLDPADQLEQIAQNFYDTADKLRLTTVGMLDAQADPILEKAQELTDGGEAFTADAIGAILDTIKPDLDNIRKVTKEACDQVNHLKTVDQIISIATSLLAVGVAAEEADPAAIIGAVQALGYSLTGTKPPASPSSGSSSSGSSTSTAS